MYQFWNRSSKLVISSFRNLSPHSNIQGETLPQELNLIRDQAREQILLLLTQLFLNAEAYVTKPSTKQPIFQSLITC